MRAPIAPLLLLLVGSAGSPLTAQRQELTVIAGGNVSSATGGRIDKSKARGGFQAGVSLRMPRSPMVSFQTELLVIQRRLYAERAPSTLSSQFVGPRSDAPNLVSAQLPLLLRIQKGYSTQRPVRPFLLLGPYIGIRLSCERELVDASGTVSHPDCTVTPPGFQPGADPYFPALYENLDVGIVAALGVEARRLSLGLRGEKSLRNLVDPGTFPTSPLEGSRLWSASLSLEYMLRVL